MSYQIQSRTSWGSHHQKPQSAEELLRSEIGWKDVASGLAKVMFGYCLIFINLMVIVGLVVYLAVSTGENTGARAQVNIQHMWVIGLGGGILFLLSLYTYSQVLLGKFRCAMHVPERCGARWFIFACILTIVVGPVLTAVDSVNASMSSSDPQKRAQLRQEMQERNGQNDPDALLALARQHITVTQIAGFLVSYSTSIFFVLFLRAIGNCFEAGRLTTLSDMYLMFSSLLFGFTIFLLFFAGFNRSTLLILAVLGLGGLISLVWYLGLVIYTRSLILDRIDNLRSPLTM